MKIGIYESEVQAMISSALGDAGLKGGNGLVLFGGKKSDALRSKRSELNAHLLKRMPRYPMEAVRINGWGRQTSRSSIAEALCTITIVTSRGYAPPFGLRSY